MSDVAISVRGLRHAFRGRAALNDVTFTVPTRCLHGFVGPNGAGKTTTLRAIATLLEPDAGAVEVFGSDVRRQPEAARRRIGFMPDHFSMYRQMTVGEYLDFFAAAYGLKPAERQRTIDDVLALTDMGGRRGDLVRGLSRGMQQRLCLARVLVHDPDLLLLDEPASGLDPRARIELMDILRELKRMGKTVFISSHILAELGDLCDSVTILDRGAVRYSGPMEALTRVSGASGDLWTIRLSAACEPARIALAALDGVQVEAALDEEGRPQLNAVFDPQRHAPHAVLRVALDAGAQVIGFQPHRRGLGEAFMQLTTAGVGP
jgi:ABC-2 type transport system ATP-binding protein